MRHLVGSWYRVEFVKNSLQTSLGFKGATIGSHSNLECANHGCDNVTNQSKKLGVIKAVEIHYPRTKATDPLVNCTPLNCKSLIGVMIAPAFSAVAGAAK
jgi:hypothetical protein